MKSEILHIEQDEQYQHLLQQVVERAKLFQYRTSIGMNQELIRFYWAIGEEMAAAKEITKCLSKCYEQFTTDCRKIFPDREGFSVRNL